MSAPLDYLLELSLGLSWRDTQVIAMIWAYLDESGEHVAGGALKRLTLGGGIAHMLSWQKLSIQWRAVLDDAGISMFHMADFEARKKPFEAWTEEKRRQVLNDLLDITSKHVPVFCGYNDNIMEISNVNKFKTVYGKNIIKMFQETILALDAPKTEKITLVFSKHKDISANLIGRYFDLFSYWTEDRVVLGGIHDPVDVLPLQVADIVAYEFSRTSRQVRPDNERYPLMRLAERATVCALYHSSQLGRDVFAWKQGMERPRD